MSNVGQEEAVSFVRDESDTEADERLWESFPEFYYGGVLNQLKLFSKDSDISLDHLRASYIKAQNEYQDLRLDQVRDEKMLFTDYAYRPRPHKRPSERESAAGRRGRSKFAAASSTGRPKRRALAEAAVVVPPMRYLPVTQTTWENDIAWGDDLERETGGGDGEVEEAAVASTSLSGSPTDFEKTIECESCYHKFGGLTARGHKGLRGFICVRCRLTIRLEKRREELCKSIQTQGPQSSDSTNISNSGAATTAATSAKVGDSTAASASVAASTPAGPADMLSKLPPKFPEIEKDDWTSQIAWEGDAAPLPASQSKPTVSLDQNDPAMLYFVKMPIKSRRFKIHQNKGRQRIPTWKLQRMQKAIDRKGLVVFGTDPFNVSNDRFYVGEVADSRNEHSLRKSYKRKEGKHARVAKQLHRDFFPTYLSKRELRNFHRPMLILPHRSTPWVLQTVGPTERSGKSLPSRKDLTVRTGHIILAEYCEEHPFYVQRPGMSTRIRTYYCPKPDADASMAPHHVYGGPNAKVGAGFENSPFLGALMPGEDFQAFDNSLFRAPVYQHRMPSSDFIVVRQRDNLYVRRINDIFCVGQLLPKVVMPRPDSKQSQSYQRDRLTVAIHRLFQNKGTSTYGRRVRVEDVRKLFPRHSEANIRKRLKPYAYFQRGGDDTGAWEWKLGDDRKIGDLQLQELVTPEDVCANESMLAVEQRLKDMGFRPLAYAERGVSKFRKEAAEAETSDVMNEVKLAPWELSANFISYLEKPENMLALEGPAEPTGCGKAFSYMRKPTSRHNLDESLLPAAAKINRPKLGNLAGCANDLRKLQLDQARNLLVTRYGFDMSTLKGKGRWETIGLVREVSTAEAKETNTHNRFARGKTSAMAEQYDKFRAVAREIFEAQNSSLSSSAVLSSDESESEDEKDEALDVDEYAALVESGASASAGASAAIDRRHEALQHAEFDKALRGSGSIATIDDAASSVVSAGTKVSRREPEKRLIITRTVVVDGERITESDTVTDERVIEAYLKERKSRKVMRARLPNATAARRGPTRGRTGGTREITCSECGEVGHKRNSRKCRFYAPATMELEDEPADIDEAQPWLDEDGPDPYSDMRPGDGANTSTSHKKTAGLKMRLSLRQNADAEDFGTGGAGGGDTYVQSTQRVQWARIKRDPLVFLQSTFMEAILAMNKSKYAIHFADPISPKEVFDYYDVIDDPMDLRTMRKRVEAGHDETYQSRDEFLKDLRLICSNALIYNGKDKPESQNWSYWGRACKLRREGLNVLLKHEAALGHAEMCLNGKKSTTLVSGNKAEKTLDELALQAYYKRRGIDGDAIKQQQQQQQKQQQQQQQALVPASSSLTNGDAKHEQQQQQPTVDDAEVAKAREDFHACLSEAISAMQDVNAKQCASAFGAPVAELLHPKEAANYAKIIKQPMDLRTMQEKLDSGLYKLRDEFLADMRRIVTNVLISYNIGYYDAGVNMRRAGMDVLDRLADRLSAAEQELHGYVSSDLAGDAATEYHRDMKVLYKYRRAKGLAMKLETDPLPPRSSSLKLKFSLGGR